MIVASCLEWGSGKTCRGVPSASARTTSSATAKGAAANAQVLVAGQETTSQKESVGKRHTLAGQGEYRNESTKWP